MDEDGWTGFALVGEKCEEAGPDVFLAFLAGVGWTEREVTVGLELATFLEGWSGRIGGLRGKRGGKVREGRAAWMRKEDVEVD